MQTRADTRRSRFDSAATAGVVRPLRIPLEGRVSATEACLLVRGDARPFALCGDWAGGAALVGSEPLSVAGAADEPFALLDRPQRIAGDGEAVVGGGWFGYLGYALGAHLERVPRGPRRPSPLPGFSLAFYDHLLRLDADGQWWFEALWTSRRAPALEARLEALSARLAEGVGRRPAAVGTLAPVAPGAAGHVAAVATCRERIAAGEIFQANLCLRLEGGFSGDPLDLYTRVTEALEPRQAALVAGPWGAVCSASPELFLRRSGRSVLTEPIKGTAPRGAGGAMLKSSAKDRAENVMIVDLMRNDLGRVCEYGTVEVTSLTDLRPAPGVWHLVSTVAGRLREDVTDGDLLRATFPPGSVTGAPKIQALRVIAELESTAREAYTGAIGYSSPVAGLELNVAIRTLELCGDRVWLGAGGGVVADSDPWHELEECLVKARPVVAAAGGELAEPHGPAPLASGRLPVALSGGSERPEPGHGVFSTMRVSNGVALDLASHLARLQASVATVYGRALPSGLAERVAAEAGDWDHARLRVDAIPGPGYAVDVELEARRLEHPAEPELVALEPVVLPGGLGEHKWRDRRLLDELARRLGATPLLVDLDGEVLEAGYANVWIVEGDRLVTPPLDGRLLPGVVRARLLAEGNAREQPITLDRMRAADEILLSSSVRGLHRAGLRGAEGPREPEPAGRPVPGAASG
jgi:para-aminobenzoate synthetase/4-amino-4-deoxychorismate lyase